MWKLSSALSLSKLGRRGLSQSTKKLEKYKFNGATNTPSIVVQNSHIDTTIWNDVKVLDSDIIVATSAKSGTTWTQEIAAQLVYNGDYEPIVGVSTVFELSVWAAITMFPKELKVQLLNEQLQNEAFPRRIIKTHEPIESTQYNPNAKYIFVGRDYRDIVWSFYNHQRMQKDNVYQQMNAERDYAFTPLPQFNFEDGSFTEYDFWKMMLRTPAPDDGTVDGYPLWSQLWVIGSWWNIRNLPNVKVIHYNNLLNDLAGNMREIAAFLDIEIDENNFEQLVENCTFEKMKNKEKPMGPMGDEYFKNPKEFFFKGINKRWNNVLTDKDIEEYREIASIYLDEEGIHWLETGELKPL